MEHTQGGKLTHNEQFLMGTKEDLRIVTGTPWAGPENHHPKRALAEQESM